MIYYVCKYTPVELLGSFQTECTRLDAVLDSFDCADSCSHPNLCGYGKAVIETVINENVKELVLTDCCDVMRRVYDVLMDKGRLSFLYLLPLPHKTGKAEAELYSRELKRLTAAYEAYSGQSFDVTRALSACQSTAEVCAAVPDGPYISLSGAHGGKHLYETVKSKFSISVIDDTCTCSRNIGAPSDGLQDRESFFSWYGEALLIQEQPCMRMLNNRMRSSSFEKPAGIVYHTMKFCDFYSFEYMTIKNKEGLPLLKIETDCTPQSEGQLKTRLEAFAETLHAETAVKSGHPARKTDLVYAAGIDSGSTSTDAVIMNADRKILGRSIVSTGSGAFAGARKALSNALEEAGLSQDELSVVVTTGYGRENIGLEATSITEITCHAKGAHYLNPEARTVIDIGGQDSKVIRIDENGNVLNFVMNDKCAAGTGRFLDMMARTMELTLDEMGRLGLKWDTDVTISSMCTVFAESEVVSLIAENTPASDIIHGLNKSVAGKTIALVKRLGGEPGFIMTGGVAKNPGIVEALQDKLGAKIFISPEAQLCGAIGAALIGLES